jgi:hypothetical protein
MVELIVAALAAGATAGVTNTATTAVQDAYTGLKRLLRPWLRGDARTALEADETEPKVWKTRIGGELRESGAVNDGEVRAAAQRLLALADPATAKAFNINAGTVNGAAGQFNAPVSFDQRTQLPPAPPAAG